MMATRGTGSGGAPRGKGRSRAGATRGRPGGAGPPPGPEPASPFVAGMAPECLVCPFGIALFTLRQARPEVVEHLLKAGHEVTLALKALVDGAAERWAQAEQLERIPVT